MPRIRPAHFVHVVYRTRRFAEMIRWYETALGATVRAQNPALAFLSYDAEHHRVALLNLDAVHPDTAHDGARGAVGVDHVAYTYASAHDLLENYAALKAEGITPYWCIDHGVTMSMYYADPDGNQMEFQVDACATPEEANAFMVGPRFAVNPVGVEYDPDALLATLRAGASEAELLAREADLPISPIRRAMAPA
jgi:catechol-2,3-dioxygenase